MNQKAKKALVGVSTLAILGASIIGETAFSKYISQISGSGSLQTAKWNVVMSNKNLIRNQYQTTTVVVNKMAPGTEGSFEVKVEPNDTEVGFDYVVDIKTMANKPTNLYFTINDNPTKYTTKEELGKALSGHVDASSTTKSAITNTVHWYWEYETDSKIDGASGSTVADNDQIDTADGQSAKTMTIEYTVTATQTKPVSM